MKLTVSTLTFFIQLLNFNFSSTISGNIKPLRAVDPNFFGAREHFCGK